MRFMNQNDQSPEVQLPIGIAAYACIVCFALICWGTRTLFVVSPVWWLEFLDYGFIPTAVAFLILNRSYWHRQMNRCARTGWLMLVACVIFCSDLLLLGIIIALLCVFAGLGRGHF